MYAPMKFFFFAGHAIFCHHDCMTSQTSPYIIIMRPFNMQILKYYSQYQMHPPMRHFFVCHAISCHVFTVMVWQPKRSSTYELGHSTCRFCTKITWTIACRLVLVCLWACKQYWGFEFDNYSIISRSKINISTIKS